MPKVSILKTDMLASRRPDCVPAEPRGWAVGQRKLSFLFARNGFKKWHVQYSTVQYSTVQYSNSTVQSGNLDHHTAKKKKDKILEYRFRIYTLGRVKCSNPNPLNRWHCRRPVMSTVTRRRPHSVGWLPHLRPLRNRMSCEIPRTPRRHIQVWFDWPSRCYILLSFHWF